MLETLAHELLIKTSVTNSSTVYVHWSTVTLGVIISGPGVSTAVIGILAKLSHSPSSKGVIQNVVVPGLRSGPYVVPV